jgi:hypothetical protein
VPSIVVATPDGLRTFDEDGSAGPTHLDRKDVTAIVTRRTELWAIVDRSELWHAADATAWSHVATVKDQRATSLVATDQIFVGTSGARLFRLAGQALEPVESFDRVEGRSSWYTPWGGPPDTRSFSEWDEAIYVNVHVGGIPRTLDGGETWTPTIDIDADIHQVTTAEDLVLAACARGLATSTDRGATWTDRREGLEAPYSRAVTVSGDTVLVTASNGPRGGRSGVYRGDLAGGGFERCRAGLPDWFDDNIDTHCLDAHPNHPFVAFGTSDGRLFASEDAGASWEQVASGLPPIQRVLAVP